MPQDANQKTPQHIPVEASDTLAFTPECLKTLKNPPSFVLRALGTRDERYLRRLYIQEGLTSHGMEEIRAEILKGLQALWTPEVYAEQSPHVTDYWEAADQHALTVRALMKEEPDIEPDDARLTFVYDAEIERAVTDLITRVEKSWPPLLRLYADNAEFNEESMVVLIAVAVESWTGLDAPFDLDGGYLTIDSATRIKKALRKLEKANGLIEGWAWAQLTMECGRRMRLDEEEAGNSASPSPSNESPEPSTTKTTPDDRGTSQASASSPKTPEVA